MRLRDAPRSLMAISELYEQFDLSLQVLWAAKKTMKAVEVTK